MTEQTLILLVSFFALLLLNVPIAICIAVATLLTVFSLGDVPTAYIVAQRISTDGSSSSLGRDRISTAEGSPSSPRESTAA